MFTHETNSNYVRFMIENIRQNLPHWALFDFGQFEDCIVDPIAVVVSALTIWN